MKTTVLRGCASVLAIGVAMSASGALAQSAPADDTLVGLDEIVVTAAAGDQKQIETSISVTSIDAQLIQDFQPSSEAEVFKLLPGIQVPGTSGPGGNSNIAVRGLPVATGGSPFVQLQEDGLPVVLFGDIQFGNNDYWTKFDASVANVEAVRGGSATTFASQAPGAVINYISNHGNTEGGYVELRKGLGYDETQANFRYGGAINDGLRFHVGGFVRRGKGPLDAGYRLTDSVQVKANITKDLGDNGYFRLLFKFADTQEPNYTGAPALADISGTDVSNVRPFPGFDGRDQTNYSKFNQDFLILERDGTLNRVGMTGISTNQKSIGAEFHYEFDGGFTVDNKFRYNDMSGSFASPFLGLTPRSSIIGSTVNGQVVTDIRFASGANAGQSYTGAFVDNNVNVFTRIRDMGSFVNDLTASAKFDVLDGELTARGGFFYMDQNIAADWHVNRSTREVNGDSPSQLDLFAGANKLTNEGIAGYSDNWGDCCSRDYDLGYTNTAPYAQLVFDNDMLNLDGSIRFENVTATGYTIRGGTVGSVVSGGVTIPTLNIDGPRETLDYSRSYTSWTAGALFKATPDLSIFARASKGGRFNADRQTVSGKFNPDGSLCTTAQADAGLCTDGVTPSVDFVNQYELGIKNRGDLGGGSYTLELTLLKGDFTRSDYEPTSTTQCPGGGCILNSDFKTQGAEFFATYSMGGFSFIANATYTKAKQRGTVVQNGNTLNTGSSDFRRADNIPDLSYSLTGLYDAGIASLGLTAVGQSSTRSGGLNWEGKTLFNLNAKVRPLENVEVGINVYNLFDTFDGRGNGTGVVRNTGDNSIVTVTPALGRTVSGSVRFVF